MSSTFIQTGTPRRANGNALRGMPTAWQSTFCARGPKTSAPICGVATKGFAPAAVPLCRKPNRSGGSIRSRTAAAPGGYHIAPADLDRPFRWLMICSGQICFAPCGPSCGLPGMSIMWCRFGACRPKFLWRNGSVGLVRQTSKRSAILATKPRRPARPVNAPAGHGWRWPHDPPNLPVRR
jgi:hypothetical protein